MFNDEVSVQGTVDLPCELRIGVKTANGQRLHANLSKELFKNNLYSCVISVMPPRIFHRVDSDNELLKFGQKNGSPVRI